MTFDAEIVLNVTLGSPSLAIGDKKFPTSPAWGHVTLRQDATHSRWHVHGRQDHRFPGTGPLWLNFRRSARTPGNIVLFNKHGHEWCELENFPSVPNPNSKGMAYFSNLNYPPCKFTNSGKWYGEWSVNNKVTQSNIQAFDPNEGRLASLMRACSQQTGFQYDTSSGFSASGSAGAAAAATHMHVILKRKEAHDKRRWDLAITAAGVGLMTPGVSVSGSTEGTPSFGLSDVYAGPGMRMPVHPNDFNGTVLFFELGGGVGAGAKGAHVGVGLSTTTFLFVGGVNSNTWYLPDISTIRAAFQSLAFSGSLAKNADHFSKGGQAMLYGGVCTSVTERSS